MFYELPLQVLMVKDPVKRACPLCSMLAVPEDDGSTNRARIEERKRYDCNWYDQDACKSARPFACAMILFHSGSVVCFLCISTKQRIYQRIQQ
jgi:hypothetical protein